MLQLIGTIQYGYKFDGQPFAFKVNQKTITFTDYNPDGKKTHTIALDPTPEPTEYRTGRDNSGQTYEVIEWRGTWCGDFDKFARVSIQTWDRLNVYVLAMWPHKHYGFRGESPEFGGESTIARLDEKSAAKLAALLNTASQPALEL